MQGLRPVDVQQDENSGIIFRGNISSGFPLGELGANSGLGQSKGTPMTGLPSARRALGNITNRGFHGGALLPGKTPRNSIRKTLGNNTNGKAADLDPKSAGNGCFPSGAEFGTVERRIEELGIDGVERMAGKGWSDLERDRESREDEEILQRLGAFTALGSPSLPSYFPHWVSRRKLPSYIILNIPR